eukprot:CAMPEP_0179325360 /NCGR_PEP_ID=MMETSP0797-20121207/60844_1 /TAXON_ID=47934 /ORGANISM="Dinophysis acuminata, Strain DAEP01" /LENGTH=148 /DNA_ID=CAMNT_0021037527 /DNA_START=152 /DNA_END=595 /DNA_ORIENTATION=-
MATPSKCATPQHPRIPGDLAPLSLAPVEAIVQSRHEPRTQSALLTPAVRRQLAHSPSLPACGVSRGGVGRELASQFTRESVCSADVKCCDDELRSMVVRQDGFEQRLTELAALLEGFTEEQSGQAHLLVDVDQRCRAVQRRLDEAAVD